MCWATKRAKSEICHVRVLELSFTHLFCRRDVGTGSKIGHEMKGEARYWLLIVERAREWFGLWHLSVSDSLCERCEFANWRCVSSIAHAHYKSEMRRRSSWCVCSRLLGISLVARAPHIFLIVFASSDMVALFPGNSTPPSFHWKMYTNILKPICFDKMVQLHSVERFFSLEQRAPRSGRRSLQSIRQLFEFISSEMRNREHEKN